MDGNEETRIRSDDPLGPVLDRYLISGDEAAMEEIVRRTRPRLMAAARRIGSPGDAEDAVQSAYFSLLRKRGGRLEAPVFPWLLTAVVRIAYRQKAVQKRQHEIARRLAKPVTCASPLPDIANAEEADRVRKETAKLPGRYRDPIVLRHLQGLSTEETADLLGIPPATVRTRLFRARKLLLSRWPVKVAHGALFLPWLFADTAKAVQGAAAKTFAAGTVKAPVAAVSVALVLAMGYLTGHLAMPRSPGDSRVRPADSELRLESLRAERDRIAAALQAAADQRDRELVRGRTAEEALAALRRDSHEARRGVGSMAVPARYAAPVRAGELKALDTVDWMTLGEVVAEVVTLVKGMAEAGYAGRETPPGSPGRVQALTGTLIQMIGKLEDGIPAVKINQRFTAPDFLANAMVAALTAFEKPLSPEQLRDLEAEVDAFLRADRLRLEGYSEATTMLTRVREEVALKDRFNRVAFEILTEEQAAALSPQVIRGKLSADMFSAAIAWSGRSKLFCYEDNDDLVLQVEDHLDRYFDLTKEERSLARPILLEWADTIPQEQDDESCCDPFRKAGWIPLGYLQEMSRSTEALLSKLDDRLAFDKVRAGIVHDFGHLFAPILVRDEEKR